MKRPLALIEERRGHGDGCASSLFLSYDVHQTLSLWSLYSCSSWSSRPQPLESGGDTTPCEDTRRDMDCLLTAATKYCCRVAFQVSLLRSPQTLPNTRRHKRGHGHERVANWSPDKATAAPLIHATRLLQVPPGRYFSPAKRPWTRVSGSTSTWQWLLRARKERRGVLVVTGTTGRTSPEFHPPSTLRHRAQCRTCQPPLSTLVLYSLCIWRYARMWVLVWVFSRLRVSGLKADAVLLRWFGPTRVSEQRCPMFIGFFSPSCRGKLSPFFHDAVPRATGRKTFPKLQSVLGIAFRGIFCLQHEYFLSFPFLREDSVDALQSKQIQCSSQMAHDVARGLDIGSDS